MSRFNERKVFTWREITIQCLAVAAMIAAIVIYLPHEGNTKLHYEKGRPWPYLRFIAPYDFPVFKSETQLKQENDSILQLYEPYFEYNTTVEHQQTEQMKAYLNQQETAIYTRAYTNFLEERLHDIYTMGVVSNTDKTILDKNKSGAVRVYQYTKASSRPSSEIYTQKTAYSYLIAGNDSAGISKKRLLQLDLTPFIQPNLKYNQARSNEEWQTLKNSLTSTIGVVISGQSIIDRGDIVSEEQYQILQSYERSLQDEKNQAQVGRSEVLGQVLYVSIILITLLLYFNLFRRDYITSNLKSVMLVVVSMLILSFVTSFLVRHTLLTVYVIPYAMMPVFIRTFMDSRTAFITHVATVLLCSVALRYHFEFISTQMVAGLVAIYSLRDLTNRSQIFRTAFNVTITAELFYLSIDLMEGRFLQDALSAIDFNIYKHLVWSGIILLMAYPLMLLVERVFGFTSSISLLELSNTNHKLLRELSETANGTFAHSSQVSNLSAAVAEKIGANPLLVRTGALYHDIGKLAHPTYFTENQEQGKDANPFNNMSEVEASKLIRNHVTDGLALAKAHKLPKVICDFIVTHHGKNVTRAFYNTYKNNHPDEDVDVSLFAYEGPNPSTKEQAILMMADAVEATSHSMEDKSEESISQMVNGIVDGLAKEGLFNDCPITFHDISKAKEVLKEKLKAIYHSRIKYPEEKKS